MKTDEALILIKNLLTSGELLQIDCKEDSYYLGTCDQLKQFRSVVLECPVESDVFGFEFSWISDSDLFLRRSFTGVATCNHLLSNFMRVVNPIPIRGIATKDPKTSKTKHIFFEYIVKDWDLVFKDGSLLIGSIAALTSALSNYDCVVNCTTNIKAPSHIHPDNYWQLNWFDSSTQNIICGLLETVEKIHYWRTIHQKRVLVICEQGISRSAACILAYLLKFYSFDIAYNMLIENRPISCPNPNFMKQLRIFDSLIPQKISLVQTNTSQ
jgi:hypothetical protein